MLRSHLSRRDSKEFKALEQDWYSKLKAEGFKDIEDTSREGRPIKEWDLNLFRNDFNRIRYEVTLSYYAEARNLLHSHQFKDETERKIWELHSEGVSGKQIAEIIQVRKYKKSTVHSVIARLAKLIKGDEN